MRENLKSERFLAETKKNIFFSNITKNYLRALPKLTNQKSLLDFWIRTRIFVPKILSLLFRYIRVAIFFDMRCRNSLFFANK